jgi:hypothetical protein
MTWSPQVRARLAVVAMMRLLGGAGSGNFGHEGRKGEVGGSGSGSDAHAALDKLPESRKFFGHVENPLARDTGDTRAVYVARGRDAVARATAIMSGKEVTLQSRDVPVHSIDSAQPVVSKSKVREYLDSPPDGSHGWGVSDKNGRVWLLDGNHRVTAAHLRGEKTVKLDVLE